MQDLAAAEGCVQAELVWEACNQRWLAARFEHWRERITQYAARQAMTSEDACDLTGAKDVAPLGPLQSSRQADFMPAAIRLATIFGLTAFERELVIVCAGLELDPGLRQALVHAQGLADGRTVGLDFSLALAVLPEPHWDSISPQGALRHWALVHFDLDRGAGHARLRIDERVLHELTGVLAFDDALLGLASLHRASPVSVERENTVRRLSQTLETNPGDEPMTAVLCATPAQLTAACTLAARAWALCGLRSLQVEADALPDEARAVAHLARRLQREAALSGAGIVLVLRGQTGLCQPALRLLRQLLVAVLVVGLPDAAQLAQLAPRRWLRWVFPPAAPAQADDLPPKLQAVVRRARSQFEFGPAELAQAIATAAAAAEPGESETVLWDTLREASRNGLDSLAQRISGGAGFADLVLPAHAMSQLHEIATQLHQRRRVYEEWGFAAHGSRGLGIAALFAGDSGTGKTLAAEAIANEARLDLYRVDLASTVSKYIGETEKNLARLFDAAQASGAVLLFDEADALFGKRSEVKDSHDRYANIEVAYLLQRIEDYRGLAILTTNLKSALDLAFLRRIRFVVQFPFPDAAARAQLWRRQFPARAPMTEINWPQLAQLQLAGGNIRNVAINAAFRAAHGARPIGQADIFDCAQAEFAKLDRAFAANGMPLRGASQ